jgi:ankyrin repeat protein
MPSKPKLEAKLRGAALVKLAIDAIPVRKPRPVASDVLRALSLGGKPLPPSLRTWLGHHSALPKPTATRLVEGPGLALSSWAEIVQRALAREAQGFDELDARLPGGALPLDVGDSSFRVLFVGEPDSAGEYPVLDVDIDDPSVTLALPGFDVWLAVLAGIVDPKKARTIYAGALGEHARASMRNAEAWEKRKKWEPHEKAPWQPPPTMKPGKKKSVSLQTELVDAVREGRVDEVRELLEDGASPTDADEQWHQTPLGAATNCAQPEILELLLDRGVGPDDPIDDDDERKALHAIADMDWWWYSKAEPQLLDRWLRCMRILLARGAAVDARDDGGRTPLWLAAGRRSLALVTTLLDHGATPACGGEGEGNALHSLLVLPPSKKTLPAHDVVACTELLLARGADPNASDDDGKTPQQLAARDPHMPREVFDLLRSRAGH